MGDLDRTADEAVRHFQSLETFGAVESVLTLVDMNRADTRAEENLLGKARRVWRTDRERGLAYVERAACLPFDEVEEAAPAALAAHLMLFSDVVDTLECSPPADSRWLDAALDLLQTATPDAQAVIRRVLAPIDQDYDMPPAERRRLRAAINSGPAASEPHDVAPEAVVDYVVTVVDVSVAYTETLAE